MSISGIPSYTPTDTTDYSQQTDQAAEDLNKTIESLSVTLIADRSMDRVKEQWEEDRKKDPL